MAVLGTGAMARYGFISESSQPIPWPHSVFVLSSFTLLIYQLDSILGLLESRPVSALIKGRHRWLIFSCFIALICSTYCCFLLPSERTGYLSIGLILISLYIFPALKIRPALDRFLPIRWTYLSIILASAAITMGGDPAHLPHMLPIIGVLLCGNLLICDFRDQDQDQAHPNRTAFPWGAEHARIMVGSLLLIAVALIFLNSDRALSQWHWLAAICCGSALLWLATYQEKSPWRMTFLADFSPVAAAIILSLP